MRPLVVITSFCFLFAGLAQAGSDRVAGVQVVVYDERFYEFVDNGSQVEILADDLGWAEGPVWVSSLDSLLFSDVAADTIYRWNKTEGVSVYLFPSGHLPDEGATAWRGSNGLAVDQSDRLILAQQGNRKIARMSKPLGNPAPQYSSLAERFQGDSLNSPNDLVVHRSGDIFFTDPPYGLSGFENSPDIELDFFAVFHLSQQGELKPIVKDLEKPNGIALSMDQQRLFVSNSADGDARIVALDLDNQLQVKKSVLFFDARKLADDGPGSTDGMAMHRSDYLFISIPNGVGILSPAGDLLGKISLGQVTNMAFDDSFSYLYITTPKQLLRLELSEAK